MSLPLLLLQNQRASCFGMWPFSLFFADGCTAVFIGLDSLSVLLLQTKPHVMLQRALQTVQ